MTDVLLYWRDYKKNWAAGERAYYWHSNAKLLGELEPGDHLWLVTSGANVGHEVKQAGFLVAIWTVEGAFPNSGEDRAYPRAHYRYRVTADPGASVALDQPVAVDHLLRPVRPLATRSGRNQRQHAGRLLHATDALADVTRHRRSPRLLRQRRPA